MKNITIVKTAGAVFLTVFFCLIIFLVCCELLFFVEELLFDSSFSQDLLQATHQI